MSDETSPLFDPASLAETPRRRPGRPRKVEDPTENEVLSDIGDVASADDAGTVDTTEMLYEITVQRSMDGGQQDIFLGPNGRTVILKRGEKVVVDAGILECLNHAVETFYEPAPTQDDPMATRPADRMRYPYVMHKFYPKK